MAGKQKAKPLARNDGCEVLGHFSAIVCEELKRYGLPEHDANKAALSLMEVMKKEFGGQLIYFPLTSFSKNNRKAVEVYEKFQAGKTIPELVFEIGHSAQWVYRLIADGRATCRAEREAKRRTADNN